MDAMTSINKPVRRVTGAPYPCRGGERRPVVVSIEPGDVLTFRFKGMRRVFSYPVWSAALAAIRCTVAAEKAERRARRRGEI